jgi:hypothetical protein
MDLRTCSLWTPDVVHPPARRRLPLSYILYSEVLRFEVDGAVVDETGPTSAAS